MISSGIYTLYLKITKKVPLLLTKEGNSNE